MSYRRCLFQCDNSSTLFALPKLEEARRTWLQHIYNAVPDHYSPSLLLCAAHFTDDCFLNLGEYKVGLAQKLILKNGAVPTLFGHIDVPETKPDISMLGHSSQQFSSSLFRTRDVGCQTEREVKIGRSVGTQLSLSTLKHVRSKGVQAKPHGVDKCTITNITREFRPRKRPFLEVEVKLEDDDEQEEEEDEEEEEEEEEEETEASEKNDPTYNPEEETLDPAENPDSDDAMSEGSDAPPQMYNESKYIVFESCLRELFEKCPICKATCEVKNRVMGTYVAYTQRCPSCDYNRQWESQPVIGSTPYGNLLVSAATYFSGGSFIQLEKICKAMQLHLLTFDAFRRHARNFLEPAIVHKWNQDQKSNFKKMQKGEKIALAGKMRTDSQKGSAKFGSYALMDLESNTVVDLQLVQCNEVDSRHNMEQEGLKRSLDLLESNNLAVDFIITDPQPKIQKFLTERNITHLYDVRRFEMGLSGKLEKLSRIKGCEILKKWLHFLKCHMYWSATSSTSGPEKVAKWTSVLNHLQNIHVHENPLYPKCEHPEKTSRDPKKWFKPGSTVIRKVEKILNNKQVLKDVDKLSDHYPTCSMDIFRSTSLRFTPKNVAFPFMGRLCRLYLAAMHYNENADRKPTTSAIQDVFRRSKTGEGIGKPNKTPSTCEYVSDLIKLLFEEVFADPTPFVEELKGIPVPAFLSSQSERTTGEDVTARHGSSFSQEPVPQDDEMHAESEPQLLIGEKH